uniref:Uncharacterized protein n=1 Tax=Coturnix japonica TaxID=93934 RepID=A0A8C2SNJ3_COTJA
MQTKGLKESCRYTSVGRAGSAMGHPTHTYGAAGASSPVTSPRLYFVLLQLVDLNLGTKLHVKPMGPPQPPPKTPNPYPPDPPRPQPKRVYGTPPPPTSTTPFP